MPDGLPRHPVVVNRSRELRERASTTGEGLPRTSSLKRRFCHWSNEHLELKVSLGVLLHPQHHFEVEAYRVGRTCRVIDLGSIELSSADGHGTRGVIPEVRK